MSTMEIRFLPVGTDQVDAGMGKFFYNFIHCLPSLSIGQVIIQEKDIRLNLFKLVYSFFERMGLVNFVVSPV